MPQPEDRRRRSRGSRSTRREVSACSSGLEQDQQGHIDKLMNPGQSPGGSEPQAREYETISSMPPEEFAALRPQQAAFLSSMPKYGEQSSSRHHEVVIDARGATGEVHDLPRDMSGRFARSTPTPPSSTTPISSKRCSTSSRKLRSVEPGFVWSDPIRPRRCQAGGDQGNEQAALHCLDDMKGIDAHHQRYLDKLDGRSA